LQALLNAAAASSISGPELQLPRMRGRCRSEGPFSGYLASSGLAAEKLPACKDRRIQDSVELPQLALGIGQACGQCFEIRGTVCHIAQRAQLLEGVGVSAVAIAFRGFEGALAQQCLQFVLEHSNGCTSAVGPGCFALRTATTS